MFKNYRLVGAKPFKKLTAKQTAQIKQKRFKNRFALLLQNKRMIKLFYQKNGKISILEKKIDVALFRVNFCSSIRSARQAILHNKVLLNDKPLLTPNYILKPGDIFSITSPLSLVQSPESINVSEQKSYSVKKLSRKNPSFEVNYALKTAIYLFPAQFIPSSFKFTN